MQTTRAPQEIAPGGKVAGAVTARPRHLLAAGAILATAISGLLWFFTVCRPDATWDFARQPGGWPGVLGFVAVSAVIHELLHVLGWRLLAGTRWRDVSFIVTYRGLGLAALVHRPIAMTAFRRASLLPGAALGIVPLAVALGTGSGLLALWGAFLLWECITDVAQLLATRTVPPSALVRSHPVELGCVVATGPA